VSRWPWVHPTSPFLIGGGFCNCQIGVVPDQNRLGVSSRKGDGMLGWTRKFQEMVQRSIVSSVSGTGSKEKGQHENTSVSESAELDTDATVPYKLTYCFWTWTNSYVHRLMVASRSFSSDSKSMPSASSSVTSGLRDNPGAGLSFGFGPMWRLVQVGAGGIAHGGTRIQVRQSGTAQARYQW
jgi:hypothetical protein